jgi:hypothetical protein
MKASRRSFLQPKNTLAETLIWSGIIFLAPMVVLNLIMMFGELIVYVLLLWCPPQIDF